MALVLDEHMVYSSDPGGPYIGTPVHYIGLLAFDDRVMARSGNIGALDQMGLKFKEGYSYPAHLVDCRSYGGFSGSPVFASIAYAGLSEAQTPVPAPSGEKLGNMHYASLFCGMFTAHRTDENPDGTVSRYGVGVVLRSDEIREALMTSDMRKERRAWDEKYIAEQPDTSFEGAGVEPADEFEQFKDLTRKLVQVPKTRSVRRTRSRVSR